MSEVHQHITDYISVLTVYDCIEILFFIVIVYRIGCWLQRDDQKTMLWHVYGYGIVMVISYICALHTITLFLMLCAPIAAIICVLLHSDTLQKNYVMVRNNQQNMSMSDDWLAILMRFCVRSMHEGRSLRIIIEHKDCLNSLLTATKLHAPITQELLVMLVSAPSFDDQLLIWVHAQGFVSGVNTHYTQEVHEPYVQENAQQYDTWIHNALLYTSKTDAIMLSTDAVKGTCTVIAQEKIFTSVSASVALRTIHHYLEQKKSNIEKGDSDVSQYTHHNDQQYRS